MGTPVVSGFIEFFSNLGAGQVADQVLSIDPSQRCTIMI